MNLSMPIALFTVLVAGSQIAAPQDASARFKVGQPFPGLAFPSIDDGRPSSIAQYRGKKILLHIFASW